MRINISDPFRLHPDVSFALSRNKAVVALESAVITHGLPRPVNLELARELESIIRDRAVTPATIALLDGKFSIGLTDEELEQLAGEAEFSKISLRNMGIGIARGLSGGTTVAATLAVASAIGIQVFATGGIGGVHRGSNFDISADLNALADHPVVVVCAGAKAILDLPATLEALESRGVPVLGYRTDNFPAFYSRNSGLPIDCRVEGAEEACQVARAHWSAGNRSAILVCNPIPEEDALDGGFLESVINEAVIAAELEGIGGAGLTPYLLEKVAYATEGKSLEANLALLRNNARLAAEIAGYFARSDVVTF